MRQPKTPKKKSMMKSMFIKDGASKLAISIDNFSSTFKI